MPSEYYLQSVELGKQFQRNNSTWGGDDCKNYHNQIRFLMDRYNAKSVLDYGCGKGRQYQNLLSYGLSPTKNTEPMTFKTRINAESVYCYDPCVAEFEVEPLGQTFDAVICTQVLGSIPDADMGWLCNKLMNYATKFVFIGLHSPYKSVKSKKKMYNSNYISYDRTIDWYKEQFKDWSGPKLYWWFRECDTDLHDWYTKNIFKDNV